MKHIYTPFLAIFLIFIIIGFSIYKQLDNKTEGLETMDPIESNTTIITRNKKKVRRRKESIKVDEDVSRVYRENFNIGNAFKSLGNKISKGVTDKILGPIKNAFAKFLQFFKAIGSYIKCGFTRIKTLPSCMQWYMLEILGKILYTPIRFLVWLISKMGAPEVRQMEKDVWNYLEQIDKMTYSSAGIHIIHYSDEIIDGCYKCKGLVPFPK